MILSFGVKVMEALLPKLVVVPYSNCAVVAVPLGFTVPFSVTVVDVRFAGVEMFRVGGPISGM
jgi:hypothetical protein